MACSCPAPQAAVVVCKQLKTQPLSDGARNVESLVGHPSSSVGEDADEMRGEQRGDDRATPQYDESDSAFHLNLWSGIHLV